MPTLWYTRCPVPTASGIALDHGWLSEAFAPDGIALTSVRSAAEHELRQAHFNHSLAEMFREGGNVPALWARGNGQPTAVIGLTWLYEAQCIVVRADDDIDSLAQLAGKRIGLPRYAGEAVDFTRAMALRGFSSALTSIGLGFDDVKPVDVPNIEIDLREDPGTGHPVRTDVLALAEGRVDAIYLKGVNAIRQLDAHRFVALADLGAMADQRLAINNGNPRTITVGRALLDRRPDLVARYLAVLIRTAHWSATHADEVRRVVARETASTVEQVRRAYGTRLHQSLRPTLDAGLVAALDDQKAFLRQQGLIGSDFDISQWIEPSILREANRIAQASAALESAPKSLHLSESLE